MPIYEYTCQSCDARFEQLVRTIKIEPTFKCPECGSSKTKRALSLFAVGAEGQGKSTAADSSPMCGRCGGPPGSCSM